MPPDVGVLDLKTGSMCHPPNGSRRQEVVATNRKAGTFTTLWVDNAGMLLRTFDKQCNLLATKRLPYFKSGYCGCEDYAVSDDLGRIVYADGIDPCNLYLLDLHSGRSALLKTNVSDYSGNVALHWLDAATVLIVRGQRTNSEQPTSAIFRYNIQSGSMTQIFTPVYAEPYSELTLDRTLLALRDGATMHNIYGFIKVIDVRNGRLVKRLGTGATLIRSQQWSPDSSELAYSEGNQLKIWNRSNDTIRVLVTTPTGSHCDPQIMGNGIIAYSTDARANGFKGSFILRDSHTGQELRRVADKVDGRIILLEELCERGTTGP